MLRDTLDRMDFADVFGAALVVGLLAGAGHEAHDWLLGVARESNPLVGVAVLGGLAILIAIGISREVQPEYDTTCAMCGEAITVDSATDGRDHAIEVHVAETPERWSLGAWSGLRYREKEDELVCSGECADAWLEEYERFKWVAGRADAPQTTAAEVSD